MICEYCGYKNPHSYCPKESLASNFEKLEKQNQALIEALEFYADAGNYVSDKEGKFICAAYQGDRVQSIAQQALSLAKKEGNG